MSDGLARPYDPFEIVPRYVWVECPLEDYAGFAVKVRSNLRNRDRKALLNLIDEVEAERKRLSDKAKKRLDKLRDSGETELLVDLIEEMSHLHDANSGRIPAAVCAYITGWNLQECDTETGECADLETPAEIGVEAFQNLEQPMVDWIVQTVLSAYRSGKPISSSKTRGESDEPASASPETTLTDEPRDSESDPSPSSSESSDTPSTSTSTA